MLATYKPGSAHAGGSSHATEWCSPWASPHLLTTVTSARIPTHCHIYTKKDMQPFIHASVSIIMHLWYWVESVQNLVYQYSLSDLACQFRSHTQSGLPLLHNFCIQFITGSPNNSPMHTNKQKKLQVWLLAWSSILSSKELLPTLLCLATRARRLAITAACSWHAAVGHHLHRLSHAPWGQLWCLSDGPNFF